MTKKLPITTILFALGFSKDKTIQTFIARINLAITSIKTWSTDFNPENYKRPIKLFMI